MTPHQLSPVSGAGKPALGRFSRFTEMLADLAVDRAHSFPSLLPHLTGFMTDELSTPQAGALLLNSWVAAVENGAQFKRGRSQIHNNGFSKVSLCKIGDEWNLRLHVWPAGRGDTRIHDHRWPFVSVVLAGTLSVLNYVEDTDHPGLITPRYRLYDAIGRGEKRLERGEDAPLRPSSFYRVAAGECHALDFRDAHIVSNTTNLHAVSLMLSGPPARDYSHSYGARDNDEILPAPREVSDQEAISQVRSVAAALASAEKKAGVTPR